MSSEFFEYMSKMSMTERKSIQKMANDGGGTFIGAAWSKFENKRYSPHRTTTKGSTTKVKRTATPKKKTPKKQSKRKSPVKVVPIIKLLKPGIRTIMIKKHTHTHTHHTHKE